MARKSRAHGPGRGRSPVRGVQASSRPKSLSPELGVQISRRPGTYDVDLSTKLPCAFQGPPRLDPCRLALPHRHRREHRLHRQVPTSTRTSSLTTTWNRSSPRRTAARSASTSSRVVGAKIFKMVLLTVHEKDECFRAQVVLWMQDCPLYRYIRPPWASLQPDPVSSGLRAAISSQVVVQEVNLDVETKSLLYAEKRCLLAGDMVGTRKDAVDIIKLYFKDNAWKGFNGQIVVLSKMMGHLKQEFHAKEDYRSRSPVCDCYRRRSPVCDCYRRRSPVCNCYRRSPICDC